MAVEIDESGFYRQDFSTASDWEIFTAQLGEVFQKLSLSDIDCADQADDLNDVFRCGWNVRTETLSLRKEKISVTSYISKNPDIKKHNTTDSVKRSLYTELMAVQNTFGPSFINRNTNNLHTVSCMFGLQQFVLIHPYQSEKQTLSSPSDFCFFLSAATVVAAEYCPMVPVFVQIYDPKLNIFLGVCMHFTLRTNFDLVLLKQSPIECRHLSGLLTIFKEKLPVNCVHPITVSVRKTYAHQTVQLRFVMNVPFLKPLSDNDKLNDNALQISNFIALPSGYFPEGRTEIYLVYDWLEVSENGAIDSPLYSDFVPSKSSHCYMHQVANADSYLTSCLRNFIKLYGDKNILETFVGRSLAESSSGSNIANALQHITDSHFHRFQQNIDANISECSTFLKNPKKIAGPLNENELVDLLAYLFPDLYPDIAKYNYTSCQEENKKVNMHRIKSAPLDSLCSRLSCLLATCNAHYGGKNGLAQIWVAFIRELRFIWNVRLSIPGVACGFPDTRTGLLNQKLQMLNYCIERSTFQKYDNKQKTKSDVYADEHLEDPKIYVDKFGEASSGTEDEDEFYDCTEYAPEGRDICLGDKKLIDCDEPLYIPFTQDPVPKTEDELQSDAESMLKLGSGSELSMQMCTSLLSDMEAFKAANPKGKMEDFIRWYSPKDWEEDEQYGNGKLSARMQVPGNTWQTVWQQAQPVPASKQKRLFDETTEAIKVLNFLETRNIGEIYELTIIPVLHAGIIKFKDIVETADVLDIFETEIEALLANLSHLSHDVEIFGEYGIDVEQKASDTERLVKKLEELETQFYQYKCFEQLTGYPEGTSLSEIKQKFREIIQNENSCSITSSEMLGKYVGGYNEAGTLRPNLDNDLPIKLIMKEYVLRVRGEVAFGPQFLRAIVTGEEVRLCGAFTENTALI